jgi:hypothetical protein
MRHGVAGNPDEEGQIVRKILIAMTVCLLLGEVTGAEGEHLRLRVRPVIAFEPSDVFVEVYIQRHPHNRFLKISGDGELFFWNSERQLEGDRSPVLSTFSYYQLPAGEYEVRAELLDSRSRVRASTTHYLKILPR